MGMGSGESLSSDARLVYLRRCLMGRRGGALAVAPAAQRKEAKEEQLVQQSLVVASSGARTTSGAGSQKHEEKSCPLVRAGCWCACDFLDGGTLSLSASSSESSLVCRRMAFVCRSPST